jgi:hypothetical protein
LDFMAAISADQMFVLCSSFKVFSCRRLWQHFYLGCVFFLCHEFSVLIFLILNWCCCIFFYVKREMIPLIYAVRAYQTQVQHTSVSPFISKNMSVIVLSRHVFAIGIIRLSFNVKYNGQWSIIILGRYLHSETQSIKESKQQKSKFLNICVVDARVIGVLSFSWMSISPRFT